jgi:hypothetical protein
LGNVNTPRIARGAVGGVGIQVKTVADLRRAPGNTASLAPVNIEAVTGCSDLSPVSVKYIRVSAKRLNLQSGGPIPLCLKPRLIL